MQNTSKMYFFVDIVTYFSEKFPKAIFEYFDLLIVRIKTLYTNELNKLKIDGKSLQSEIDSVRRILQGQEQLLTEK